MATFTGPVFVPNPVPIVDRYGLFTVATGPLTLPEKARGGGIQYETGTCVLPRGLLVQCGPSDPEKVIESTPDVIVGTPFVVYAELACGTVGLTQERARTFLMERLKAGEQAIVENIFSDQLFDQSPGLANNPNVVTVTPGTGAEVTDRIADLEASFYAAYGLVGTIHVPMILAQRLQQGGGLRWDGRLWRTAAGSLVSFGNYSGNDPDGTAPAAGTTNVYMTGQVTIWRTPDAEIFIPPYAESIDRATNQVAMVAEREYTITLDCAVHAINVVIDPEVTP